MYADLTCSSEPTKPFHQHPEHQSRLVATQSQPKSNLDENIWDGIAFEEISIPYPIDFPPWDDSIMSFEQGPLPMPPNDFSLWDESQTLVPPSPSFGSLRTAPHSVREPSFRAASDAAVVYSATASFIPTTPSRTSSIRYLFFRTASTAASLTAASAAPVVHSAAAVPRRSDCAGWASSTNHPQEKAQGNGYTRQGQPRATSERKL